MNENPLPNCHYCFCLGTAHIPFSPLTSLLHMGKRGLETVAKYLQHPFPQLTVQDGKKGMTAKFTNTVFVKMCNWIWKKQKKNKVHRQSKHTHTQG